MAARRHHESIYSRIILSFIDDGHGLRSVFIVIEHQQYYDEQRPQDRNGQPEQCNAERSGRHDDRKFFIDLEDQTETRQGNPIQDFINIDDIYAESVGKPLPYGRGSETGAGHLRPWQSVALPFLERERDRSEVLILSGSSDLDSVAGVGGPDVAQRGACFAATENQAVLDLTDEAARQGERDSQHGLVSVDVVKADNLTAAIVHTKINVGAAQSFFQGKVEEGVYQREQAHQERAVNQRNVRQRHELIATNGRSDRRLHLNREDEAGRERAVKATLVDFSASGVGLRISETIAASSTVSCDAPELGIVVRGFVRYCESSGAEYLIGVECGEEAGWRPSSRPCGAGL